MIFSVKNLIKQVLVFVILSLAVATPVLAANTSTFFSSKKSLADCVLGDATEAFSADCRSINTFVDMAIKVGAFALSVIGAVALGAFVYGGFNFVISGGNAEKIKKGTDAMTAAVIGLIIAFGGYFLIQVLTSVLGVQSGFILMK